MNEVRETLFSILTDYIHQSKSERSLIDEDKLAELSRIQGIGGIIYKQTRIPELSSDYFNCIYQHQNRIGLINEIINLFAENEIPSFIVKGPIIAEYYPDPFLRTMGDVDIIVHPNNMDKAASILELAGYHFDKNEFQREFEWHFSKNRFHFELHHALLYKERVNNDEYVKYFDKCWDWVKSNKLNSSFHFLYVILHMRKHFLNGGIGIRFFIDLAMLSKSNDIDWPYVKRELLKLKLLSFTIICFGLCQEWFGIKNPFEDASLTNEFICDAKNMVITNGIFGNIGNPNVIKATNLLRKYNEEDEYKSVKTRKAVYVLHTLFPPYKDIICNNTYKFVKGRPFLLPIAWIYRIFYALVTRPKESLNELINPYKYSQEINIREELYKKWNL